VRHTLPLRQAREAMVAKDSDAAVVVDDNFTPMGLVFVGDIEAELVKQQLLLEPDDNFGRPS
jgi:CBS domain-containing protein